MAQEEILSLTVDNEPAKRAVNELGRDLDRLGDKAEQAAADVDRFSKANDNAGESTSRTVPRLREVDRAYEAMLRRIPGTADALQRYAQIQQRAAADMASGRLQLEQYNRVLAEAQQRYVGATNATQQAAAAQRAALASAQQYSAAQTAAATSTGQLRGALGGLGFQLQDSVVQLQMGTNALVVLAQQGSQAASAFGPAGAAIGTVIAIAAALGMAMGALGKETDFAKEATQAMDRAQQAVSGTLAGSARNADDLAKKYRTLSVEMKAVEALSIASAQRQIGAQQDILRGLVDQQVAQLERRRREFEASERLRAQGLAQLDPAQIERFAQMRKTFEAIDKFRAGGSVGALALELDKLARLGGDTAEPLQRMADDLASNAKQADTLTKQWERNEAAGRLLAGTATAADRALLSLGDTAGDSGSKVRSFADVLEDLNEKGRELARQRLDRAFDLIGRTIEDGLTPAQRYERQVRDLNDALALARSTGWEPSAEAVRAMNRALQESDPAWQEAKRQAEDFSRDVQRTAKEISGDLSDFITRGITEGFDKGFSGLGDVLKRWFARIGSRVLETYLFEPITEGLVRSVPQLFGLRAPSGTPAVGPRPTLFAGAPQ